jgi:hypothetical protein
MVLATLFTHEYFIADTTPEHFDASMAAISQQIAPYRPMYVTYDEAARYVRALVTSRLTGAEYDTSTRMLTTTFSGDSDLPTRYSVYTDVGGAIQRDFVQVPAFSGGYTHSALFDVLTPTATPTPAPINCPCSIWPAAAAPAVANQPDASAVELGLKFRADVSGTVSGVRFYKGPANTGTHVGSLWTASGQLLARATFANETASGWQQVNFTSPVSIAANTTYVVSYHTTSGQYAVDQDFFTQNGVDRAPLHALSSAAGQGNGVYAYAAKPAFPQQTYVGSNYWVDVVFNPRA